MAIIPLIISNNASQAPPAPDEAGMVYCCSIDESRFKGEWYFTLSELAGNIDGRL